MQLLVITPMSLERHGSMGLKEMKVCLAPFRDSIYKIKRMGKNQADDPLENQTKKKNIS